MSEQIIPREVQERKRRGIEIAAANMVRRGKKENCYHVHSQTDEQIYFVTPDRCTCMDIYAHSHDILCKHRHAAHIYDISETAAADLAKARNISLPQLEGYLLDQLQQAAESGWSDKLLCLLHAARRLMRKEDQASGDYQPVSISLILRCRTSGGKNHCRTDEGELIEIIEEGFRRKPKTKSPNKAIRWLMDNGYVPAGRTWLDPAGYIRRYKLAYVKVSA